LTWSLERSEKEGPISYKWSNAYRVVKILVKIGMADPEIICLKRSFKNKLIN